MADTPGHDPGQRGPGIVFRNQDITITQQLYTYVTPALDGGGPFIPHQTHAKRRETLRRHDAVGPAGSDMFRELTAGPNPLLHRAIDPDLCG